MQIDFFKAILLYRLAFIINRDPRHPCIITKTYYFQFFFVFLMASLIAILLRFVIWLLYSDCSTTFLCFLYLQSLF